jgi:probable HAF family extracellular repeat protein
MHRKAVFASLVLVFTGQALGQEASLVGIGDLIGGEYVSRGRAISADGRTVVGDSSSFRGYWGEPAVWTADRGLFGIGLLDQDTQGGANGVSPDGRWVVGSSRRGTRSEAFLWSEGTGMVGLGDLQSGAFRSSAMGVSADGGVVVGYGNVWRDGGERSEAFRWTPGGGMEGLGSLGGPVRQSHAYDVSADGSVIVGSSSSDDGGGAFRWTADTGMVALDVLDDRLPSGAAWSVSHEGDWAAGEALRYNRDGRRETHAVRWGPDGAVEWLGFPTAWSRGSNTCEPGRSAATGGWWLERPIRPTRTGDRASKPSSGPRTGACVGWSMCWPIMVWTTGRSAGIASTRPTASRPTGGPSRARAPGTASGPRASW